MSYVRPQGGVDAGEYSNGDSMRAVVQDRYGSADVLKLEDIDETTARNGEVLVRVAAASAFIGGWHIMTGTPYAIRLVSGMRHRSSGFAARMSRAPSRRSASMSRSSARATRCSASPRDPSPSTPPHGPTSSSASRPI